MRLPSRLRLRLWRRPPFPPTLTIRFQSIMTMGLSHDTSYYFMHSTPLRPIYRFYALRPHPSSLNPFSDCTLSLHVVIKYDDYNENYHRKIHQNPIQILIPISIWSLIPVPSQFCRIPPHPYPYPDPSPTPYLPHLQPFRWRSSTSKRKRERQGSLQQTRGILYYNVTISSPQILLILLLFFFLILLIFSIRLIA